MSDKYPITSVNETDQNYLIGIADRLKNLGVSDEDTISAAILCQIINDSKASFNEIDERFGSRIAVMVLSLSKDKKLPKAIQEEQYLKQIREAVIEVKMIKLCEISANVKRLKNTSLSHGKKVKQLKKNMYYLNIIKSDLIKSKKDYPMLEILISGINDVLIQFKQNPVLL